MGDFVGLGCFRGEIIKGLSMTSCPENIYFVELLVLLIQSISI